ncbi:hypothetical protein FC093_22035 [Ilyomonas limi]|jgi:uncharacterized protein YciI|uniref:YCII-related domain-containing protein n=1 Tax=Ilyomonas limi TaxID=2575867 RepID=A0A4U3KT26_9BACT|nr:YciI family protein [Ilyomonas limi]TKK64634.1 hypothetical protein FC093_22035 [Ilyomonas limi]
MKKVFFLWIFFLSSLLFCLSGIAQQKPNKDYDSTLAKKLGADERGMKMYVLAMLKSGTATGLSQQQRDSIFAGHFKNINRLASEGKLLTAGPLEKNDQNYRGIYVFNVSTVEEGKQLVATDPAVQAKVFDFDLFLWYGTAAFMQLPEIHTHIHKYAFE